MQSEKIFCPREVCKHIAVYEQPEIKAANSIVGLWGC
jgi:hypothetical protein